MPCHPIEAFDTGPWASTPSRRPDPPVPPISGTAAIGAVVRPPATAVEEGRDLSSTSGILTDTAYRLPPA
ncbi:hypothetical protein ACFCW6_35180 [Streptomyces sp. NPDC056333]|uniref:hypothetical protein n=1 Tax=Streptomyces sp. NPDC056333 TaxID=3345786 RepID=UPI0035E29CEA